MRDASLILKTWRRRRTADNDDNDPAPAGGRARLAPRLSRDAQLLRTRTPFRLGGDTRATREVFGENLSPSSTPQVCLTTRAESSAEAPPFARSSPTITGTLADGSGIGVRPASSDPKVPRTSAGARKTGGVGCSAHRGRPTLNPRLTVDVLGRSEGQWTHAEHTDAQDARRDQGF